MSDWQYPGLPEDESGISPCDGCHECGMRCTSGIQMTDSEFAYIVAHLATLDPRTVLRVLEQEKQVHWDEEVWREACLFYDVVDPGCLIYPVRPLICRLFGRVEWLPCPSEKPLPLIHGGLDIIQVYAGEQRATFPEWCMAHGIFDLRRLVGDSRGGARPKLPPQP
jgi:Putative zinc- or iron-chelating domain